MRRRVVAGLALALLVSASASAGGRLPIVVGDYTYHLNGSTSHVEIVAFSGHDGVSGWFRFNGTYVDLGGVVTCVTVRGADAWVAGVIENAEEVGFDGWMIRVKDHGLRDRAVTFMDDYGVALPWCEGASTEYDAGNLQPLAAGWLVIR